MEIAEKGDQKGEREREADNEGWSNISNFAMINTNYEISDSRLHR